MGTVRGLARDQNRSPEDPTILSSKTHSQTQGEDSPSVQHSACLPTSYARGGQGRMRRQGLLASGEGYLPAPGGDV